MPNIHILPEQLSNQIAAGEVVERPASVVKELIENSLDSGAKRIEVEIEGSGTRLIKVIDNGQGMDEDDALLCFERHGTSKIKDDQDLAAIGTLGFRGEAIPSIASVSKMSITTRAKNAPLGTLAVVEYGKLIKTHETGCSQGTIVEVRNLFGRTPARKKFLRTSRTELGHIDEVIKNYALSYPDVGFTLKVNGKDSLVMNEGLNLEKRLRQILSYNDTFIKVGGEYNPKAKKQLLGFLVPPEKSIASSARLRLFINNRAVRDKVMSHGVGEGLRSFLLKGHAPAGFLHLYLPKDEIDVNVHPAKHEVRFRDTSAVHQFIKQTVEEAVHSYQQTIRKEVFGQTEAHRKETVKEAEEILFRETTPPPSPNPLPFDVGRLIPKSAEPTTSFTTEPQKPGATETPAETTDGQVPPKSLPPQKSEDDWTVKGEGEADHGLHVIGQFKNLYIFCQSGDNLFVVDQHAAHERLLFEQLKKQFLSSQVTAQNLLFPVTIELSPFQIQLVENNIDQLNRLGFSLSEFGGNSYVISSIPAMAGTVDPTELFFDILEGFGKEGGKAKRSHGDRLEEILATMACKSAIKSGDRLSEQEINALLNKMQKADLFSHCPHGRPVVRSFSTDEIKKWFYRT